MSSSRTSRKPVRRAVALVAVVGLGLPATAASVHAFNPQPEPPSWWAPGLTHEQSAHHTAVNLAVKGQCVVEWSWMDASGATVARSRAEIPPGGFASDLYHPPEPVDPRDGTMPARTQIRAAVTPLTKDCELATTLEIFDNADGRSRIALSTPPGR